MKRFDKKTIAGEENRAGIYKLYGKGKKLLYVGKSSVIKHRLQSYYQEDDLSADAHDEKKELRPKIKYYKVRYLHPKKIEKSEENLIKKRRPKFNIRAS